MSEEDQSCDDKRFYPDLLPDEMTDKFAKIERLPSMQKHAPKISWGKEFESWPADVQLKYAMKLAHTMNHAADEMQKDRNRLSELCADRERRLNAAIKRFEDLRQANHDELQRQGAENQKIFKEIQRLTQENKKLVKMLRRFDVEV